MGTTPVYALPYPAATDPADVPVDMQELAERVEAVLATLSSSTLIATQTLSSAGQFSFASIPQTYTHLRVVASLRSNQTVAGGLDTVNARFNGDSSAIYISQGLFAAETTATAFGVMSEGGARLGTCSDTTLPNNWSPLAAEFPGYRQAARKQWHASGYAPIINASGRTAMWGGQWPVSAAITAIQVLTSAAPGYFATGSICSLYGVR